MSYESAGNPELGHLLAKKVQDLGLAFVVSATTAQAWLMELNFKLIHITTEINLTHPWLPFLMVDG
jgi:hypothetical protein